MGKSLIQIIGTDNDVKEAGPNNPVPTKNQIDSLKANGVASTVQGTPIYTSVDVMKYNRHYITNNGTDSIKVVCATDDSITDPANATYRAVRLVDLSNAVATDMLVTSLPAGAYGCVVGVFKYLRVLKNTADANSGDCEIIHTAE